MSEHDATAGARHEDKVSVISGNALESIERAQIDMQIATAKRYPRDIHKVKQGMISMATLDRETAQDCFYSLPRGGRTIQGPGVRLAEIAIYQFGNIRVQTRILEVIADGPTPHVTVQGVCADLERNVAASIEKRRRIVGKKAKGGIIDEDDINLAVNSCAAIAFRDAAFKIIPGALVKPAFDAARRVAIGDAKTLVDLRTEAMSRFAKMAVDEARVLRLLGRSAVEAVDLNDLETLFGLFTAIRDGQTTIDEAFPVAVSPADGKTRSQQMAERLGKSTQESPSADAPPADVPGHDELVAAIRPLYQAAKPSKIAKAMDAVGIAWQDGEAWEQAGDEKLARLLDLLADSAPEAGKR
jgi:hypothetical protein